MSITQSQIAEQAGVSRSTVSHVLNGRAHMASPKVRDHILKIAKAEGYYRNALVSSLKSKRMHVIGIIVPGIEITFFSDIIRSIIKEAKRNSLQCFVCQTDSENKTLESDISALREYRVDGLLVISVSPDSTADAYRTLRQQSFPFVTVDAPAIDGDAPFVGNNNQMIGYIATQHLIELGHRRIAYIRGFPDLGSNQRYEGYLNAMKEAGIPHDPKLVLGNSYEFETGVEATQSLIDNQIDFTSIVTPSDLVALGAIRTLTNCGLTVPSDVSVIGCANLNISKYANPPLTTVDQNPEAMGRFAVQLLIDQIEGHEPSVESINIKPSLVERSTTAPPCKKKRLITHSSPGM